MSRLISRQGHATGISMQRRISVTVSTYNRCNLLERILISLNNQTVCAELYEVIVCDSHSSDGTDGMIVNFSRIAKYHLRHVHTKNNLAAKRNIGISEAAFPLVVFLDDDCIPDTEFVARYLEAFADKELDELVAICGEVRYPEEFVNASNYYRFRDSRHYGPNAEKKTPATLDYKTIVVMNMCFARDTFLKNINGVDESFIGYGAEDQDLGWRMQQAGYEIITCDARIYHYETTGTISAYGSKIRRASRDGMSTLLRVNSQAAFGIKNLRKLDHQFPERTIFDKLTRIIVMFLILMQVHIVLAFFLEKTDRARSLYFPKAYRFLMGIYYVQGSLNREFALTAQEAELGWEK